MTDASQDDGAALLLRALTFAADKHHDQRRRDAEASLYIDRPIQVAEVIATVGGVRDPIVLAATVLHDTLEDIETIQEELEAEFGLEVRRLVEEVTDGKSLPKAPRKRLQVEHAPSLSRGRGSVSVVEASSGAGTPWARDSQGRAARTPMGVHRPWPARAGP